MITGGRTEVAKFVAVLLLTIGTDIMESHLATDEYLRERLFFRVFCGDLGNEVTDEVLASAFRKYKSFDKARVVRDKRTGKTKGYGMWKLIFGPPGMKAKRGSS